MKQKKGKEGADGEVEWVEVGGDRGEEYGEVGKRHSKGRRKGRGDYIGVRVRPPPAEASLAPPPPRPVARVRMGKRYFGGLVCGRGLSLSRPGTRQRHAAEVFVPGAISAILCRGGGS